MFTYDQTSQIYNAMNNLRNPNVMEMNNGSNSEFNCFGECLVGFIYTANVFLENPDNSRFYFDILLD